MKTRRNLKKHRSVRLFEALETRRLLANVAWDGGPTGDGTNFSLAANWAGDVLPSAGDTATIGATGTNPTITVPIGTPAVQVVNTSRNIQLVGASLAGGTWTFSGGANLLGSNNTSTLANVTISGGDLVLNSTSATVSLSGTTSFPAARLTANNATLSMAAGYTLNSLVSVEGATAGTRAISMAAGGAGTITFGPSATVRIAAGSGGGLSLANSSTSTLINNGTISAEASGQTLTVNNSAFTNNATMQVTAGAMNIQSTNWSNAATGSITAADSTTLTLGASWSNAGTLALNGGELNLGGTFSTSGFNFAGFSRGAGSGVDLTGTLNNTGNTLNLNAATGSWNMRGGTINGGSVTASGGATLGTTISNGTLNNVAFSGADLIFNATSAVLTVSGTTSFPAARLMANNATISMAPGYTLNSLVSAEGATAGTRAISMAAGGAGTITFGPSAVVRLSSGSGGGLALSNSSAATLINNGTISAEATGRTLTVQNTAFTNNATMQVTAGTLTINPTNWSNSATGSITAASGSTLTFGGAWSNAGTLAINGAELNLGGTFTTAGFNFAGFSRSAGSGVDLTGTLTNTGDTLNLNAVTGSWNMRGGTINGGSVVASAGSTLFATISNGTLTNVAFSGADILMNVTSAVLTVGGTTTFPAARLTANNATLSMAPGYTLNSLVVAEGATTGTRAINMAVGGTGTVTFGPSAIVRLAAGSGGGLALNNSSNATLINNGTISAEATGQTLTVQNTALTNNATMQVTAGTMNIRPTNWSNAASGTITAATGSTLTFGSAWSNAGALSTNGATLNLGGTFSTPGFNFAGFSRTGGTVNLTGALDNTGATLTLNAGTGTWNLSGGTIDNGSVVIGSGGSTLVPTSTGGTLASVAVSGADLVFNTTSAVVTLAGNTSFPAARLMANNATINMTTGYTLNSLISAEGATAGTRNINMAMGGSGTVTFGPSAIVRLASDCGGNLSLNNSSDATLVNNGLISGEAPSRTLTFTNTAMTNAGTIQALAGTINLASPTVSLGGTTSVANGALFHVGINSAGSSVVVEAGADVTVSRFRTPSLTINGSATLAPNGAASEVTTTDSLAFGANGRLDMNNNDMIIDYPEAGPSPIPAIQAMINAARNGGAWDGASNLASTAAKNASPKITTLAALESLEYRSAAGPTASFDNQAIDDTCVLVKYTYYGDTDFNGIVNFDDYSRTDAGFNGSRTGWFNGDFDGNGVINFDDYSLIDLAFNAQGNAQRPATKPTGGKLVQDVL